MKNLLIIILTFVFTFSSCAGNQQNSSNAGTKTKNVSIKGKVVEIQRGKDGYTAKIEAVDKKIYSATISSVALEKNYREVKIGEIIEVEGESISSDGSMVRVTALY